MSWPQKSVHSSKIEGRIKVPASKSLMQRTLAAALLAPGRSLIKNPSFCRDALAAINAAWSLGASIKTENDLVTIDGGLKPRAREIDCGEAGLSLRMFTPIAALVDQEIKLTGSGTLAARPMGFMEKTLKALGAACSSDHGFPPLTVQGPLAGGYCSLDGNLTSQFLSGLLLALPLTQRGASIQVENLQSRSYAELTLEVMSDFGISAENEDYMFFRIPGGQTFRPAEIEIEGDWSAASFLLVAGALAGQVSLSGLAADSKQADRRILEALEDCGAYLEWRDGLLLAGKNSLHGFCFDAAGAPDLFPPLVALAVHCSGTSRIHGVHRLKHKESDRGQALGREFSKLGASISFENDCMLVRGGSLRGGRVDSHRDHRIAMSLAVAALAASSQVSIADPDCVTKSYAGFFQDLATLGARTT